MPISSLPPATGALVRRASITVGAVAFALLGTRIPLPFIDPLGFQGPGLLGLGLAPLLLAFVVVECVAGAIPSLRRLRHGSGADRLLLVRAAWVLALAFAAVQAASLVASLRTMRTLTGEAVLAPALLDAVAVGASLVAGSLLLGLAAGVVSRHGLGNGFAVIIAAQAVEVLLRVAAAPATVVGSRVAAPPILLDAAVVWIAVTAVAVLRRRRAATGEPAVPVPTCGLVPLDLAPGLLTVLLVLAPLFPALAPRLAALGVAVDASDRLLGVAVTVSLALLLARLFCSRSAVLAAWARAAPAGLEPDERRRVSHALAQANRLSVLLVAALATLQWLAPGLAIVALQLVVGGAVLLDVAAEVRARSRGATLVSVWPLHRVYAIEPVQRALSDAGVSAHARTRSFRALNHFFAPYAPIEILVPAEQAEEAAAICARIA